MDENHETDVVVIGAGPTGENVADYAHRGGLSVTLVESELVGGECSYWACIPSKALLRPVQSLAAARRVRGAGEALPSHPTAVEALARRDSFVSDYEDSGQEEWVRDAGITLVRGHGRISGERRVRVETADGAVEIRARVGVVVCTGTSAAVPPIDGLRESRPWTSREVTAMTAVPARLAIIGGGVVACEMAAAVAGLGAEQVTMLVREDRVLTNAEPFASELVLAGLTAQGIDVRFDVNATNVHRHDAGVTLTLDAGGPLEADEVLVAAGRRPRTEDLGLTDLGLEPGAALSTDDTLAVEGVPGSWLFAAGDVNGRAPLTHHGKYQARLLGARLAQAAPNANDVPTQTDPWGPFTPTADERAFVQVIYTDPQVAMVGPTQAQAAERGLHVRKVEIDLGSVAGASLHADGYTGWASMLVDVDRDVVVGLTYVGQDVAEMVHAATVAIVGEVPMERLWHTVPAFPTMSEAWLRLLEEWQGG